MSLTDKRFYRPLLAALLVVLAMGATGWAKDAQSEREDPCTATEWMHGVPHGCRLLSLDLLDRHANTLDRKTHIDVIWTYANSDEAGETAALISDINILDTEPRGIIPGEGPILRVIVALTPRQANRLKLAAICGTLRVETKGEGLSTWSICRVEDRTQAIEARLIACTADGKALERPTLAVPTGASSGGARSVITVPVEIEFQQ